MTQLPKLKLVVLGSKRVGKSAVIVRFLTKRFIGEYRSNSDWLYKQTVPCDSGVTTIEILDVSQWSNNDGVPTEQIRWGDAFVIIYDICERPSYEYAVECLAAIRDLKSASSPPVLLLGNKRDLEHSRQVALDEGHQTALQTGGRFAEVSAAEGHLGVSVALQSLIREWLRTLHGGGSTLPSRQRKISMATVSKAFGAMFGRTQQKGRRLSFSL